MNSIHSLPICNWLVASKLMFNTISPSRTNWRGTRVDLSTRTAIWGVYPLSVHHSYNARSKYGFVEISCIAILERERMRQRHAAASVPQSHTA